MVEARRQSGNGNTCFITHTSLKALGSLGRCGGVLCWMPHCLQPSVSSSGAKRLKGPQLAMSWAEGSSCSPVARRLTSRLPKLCCPPLQPVSRVNMFLQYVLFIACFTKRGFARCWEGGYPFFARYLGLVVLHGGVGQEGPANASSICSL